MAKLTRRQMLEDSLFAATAAALAGTVTRTVQAEEEKVSASPNEKLQVAVLGVRGRGGDHIGGFKRRSDTAVSVLCDPDEAVGKPKAAKLAEETKHSVRWEKDLRKVMEDPSIDIVSIATPNHWHALAAIWALQAGKDVYVEKPVSHNVSEGRRIVEAAEKYGKIVQVGTQSRSNPGTQQAMEFLHSGGIGEVKVARGLCFKSRPSIGPKGNYDVPASIDYELWSGPAPVKPLTRKSLHYDWHWMWDYGNGDLGNQGIHQMDLARWGLNVSGVGQSVISYGGRLGYIDAGETANTQVSIHDYGDKKLVFEVRGLKTDAIKGAKVGVIFYGTNGYLVLDSYAGGAAFDKDENLIKKFSGAADHYDNFLKAVHSRNPKDLNGPIEDGHYSSALCHLGNVSYRLGQQISMSDAEAALADNKAARITWQGFQEHLAANNVNLDETPLYLGANLTLKGETFTGNLADKANPMLSREYTKGFEVPAEGKV